MEFNRRLCGTIGLAGTGVRPHMRQCHLYSEHWGRPGFDAGIEAAQGMPRTRALVNPSGIISNANDTRFALAA